jgi:hypothetical protein
MLRLRFLLGNLLSAKLEKAADKGEDARVLTVLAAGKGGTIDIDDLGLKENTSLKRKADVATAYNDLFVEVNNKEFGISKEIRKLPFVILRSDSLMLFRDSSTQIFMRISPFIFVIRISFLVIDLHLCSLYLTKVFGVSQDDCAEYMIYNMLRPEHKIGAHFIDNKGDEASKSPYFGNDDIRAKVWQHSVEVTGLEETK